jgi:hypothetical protein
MNRIVILIVAAGLLSAACSSSGSQQQPPPAAAAAGRTASSTAAPAEAALVPKPIQGCVPVCNPPGLAQPGKIPERPYKTQWFFGAEMVITPSEPWSIHEDSTGEFSLTSDAAPDNDVLFWEDVYPIEDNKRVPGVPLTVKGLLAWLRTTPRLDVSAPRPGMIGRSLPATVVDVTIAKGATNEDPGCPTRTCVDFLGYPQWDLNFGISEPQIQRFYLSNVTYGGRKHLFIAVIYPNDPRDMNKFLPHGEKLIATVQVPATPG